MTDIDHDNTDEAVCPYCGHKQGDTWEYFRIINANGGGDGDETTADCDYCQETFIIMQNISVDYSTSKTVEKP